jgi:hypothetical protein
VKHLCCERVSSAYRSMIRPETVVPLQLAAPLTNTHHPQNQVTGLGKEGRRRASCFAGAIPNGFGSLTKIRMPDPRRGSPGRRQAHTGITTLVWRFHDGPKGMLRSLEQTAETAGLYNTLDSTMTRAPPCRFPCGTTRRELTSSRWPTEVGSVVSFSI